ncbi:NAD-dependent epimerase/dehydratase family protein [Lacrimispora saccharolytica]|uniref:NAD-dependent epimerase/dehydratase n=1 Tax=Lacrimispora saccharolytica (strain ATCC 35040 / DSM 2544 / NRCC 2533 / WM1) TaxID=610130 RepID=D9R4L6_LACSW|nr:NAD(P)-dependent oxidoreductase [Lacrimispora saccharolytica]ADL03200.1 NAD-dependent epimerase/dehydratase [[Clostridium] saccharolyticum WM1]QRV18620.1 NAD(P)-dependent oxidoreductase [Lacrimispora saccharolytica]
MNVVVTGATSFLGRALVDRLLKEKHQVFAVVRPGSRNVESLGLKRPGLIRIERNLEDLHELVQVIHEPCQSFYHFGWDGSGSENRMKREVQQKNVEDSLKALEGARRLGCRRFLFSGSQAEYGIHKEAMTEGSECRPVSEYGRAKLDFLERARSMTESWRKTGISEMEYIHSRIFSIYGPGDHPWSLVESCLKAFGAGEYISLGECTQIWNFLYLDDCIRALILLMEQEKGSVSGVYNVAAPEGENRPLKDYIRTMYEVLGSHGSYSFGRRKPNAEGPANLIPDIKKLEKTTGWQPFVSFQEGIRKTYEAEG